ncbi:MAG: hypothetical protein ABSG35_15005 [Syntrophobacteraceae bacterium]|jgi:hypothetical protein
MIDLYNTLLKKKNQLFPRSHAGSADTKCGAVGGKAHSDMRQKVKRK